MMAKLYEKASRWAPSGVKELVRKGATRVGCQIGRLPGIELLSTHLATLFNRLRINCILDVGAHVGQYGRFLRNLGYQGRIVSFEPIGANFAVLEQRLAGDRNWNARRLALGHTEGTIPINVTNLTQFSSFLPPNSYSQGQFGHLSAVDHTEEVEVRRLDSVWDEVMGSLTDPRVFLKLDTQGYDLKVLEGSGVHLGQVAALQSELAVKPIYEGMTGYMEAISAMNEMGFELTGLFPVTRDVELKIVEFDCVMTRSRDTA
jgi:FkbM family methyltransferase